MKKINLFFDVGSTLHHPLTENWFITPNFFNILGYIDLDIVLDARTKVTNKFVTCRFVNHMSHLLENSSFHVPTCIFCLTYLFIFF